jgi:FO synthase subunit 2
MAGSRYVDLCSAIKNQVSGIHIHGFSPEEVLDGSEGPGWSEIITTAHHLGIPTTSTIMYGHVETARHCAEHLVLLRSIQLQTGDFTEFVPLSIIHTEAPVFRSGLVPGVRPGPTGDEVLRMNAVSRLMLNRTIDHLQASWVKQGIAMAQAGLNAGADDLGGTLMNESISTAAGAAHGHFMRPGTCGTPFAASTVYQPSGLPRMRSDASISRSQRRGIHRTKSNPNLRSAPIIR